MATTTPNFGWPVPTSTDLVKDGATAIEALGDAIDASLVDLEGGTTGQILAKASNTDMDFAWITNDVGDITAVTAGTGISGGGTSGAVTITNSMATEIAAKGDLIVGTGSQTFDNLSAGANDLLVTAASGETTGLKYTGGWTDYTPTLTNITLGNGQLVARYCQIGKLITIFVGFKMGSTSVMGNFPRFTVPIAPSQNVANFQFTGEVLDSGVADYLGVLAFDSTNAFINVVSTNSTYGTPTAVGTTTPFTWATNDGFQFVFSYEVA
jgi:hypothetical protein